MKKILILSVILFSIFVVFMCDRKKCHTLKANGNSMEPYFKEGGKRTFCEIEPKIGDSIVFECKKCINPIVHKFLLSKKGDCIYVVGGNKKSNDSRKYGWLCGNDYKILGVVSK